MPGNFLDINWVVGGSSFTGFEKGKFLWVVGGKYFFWIIRKKCFQLTLSSSCIQEQVGESICKPNLFFCLKLNQSTRP